MIDKDFSTLLLFRVSSFRSTAGRRIFVSKGNKGGKETNGKERKMVAFNAPESRFLARWVRVLCGEPKVLPVSSSSVSVSLLLPEYVHTCRALSCSSLKKEKLFKI